MDTLITAEDSYDTPAVCADGGPARVSQRRQRRALNRSTYLSISEAPPKYCSCPTPYYKTDYSALSSDSLKLHLHPDGKLSISRDTWVKQQAKVKTAI
uniref:Uncharacterized protein n=1 Tax=Knipowitschia caucasica TaxID=637954 RepID=A0AAV2MJ16_KNICA